MDRELAVATRNSQADADPLADVPVGIEGRNAAGIVPPIHAVDAEDAVIRVVRRLVRDRGGPSGLDPSAVVRVDGVDPARTLDVLMRLPRQ